MSFPERPPLHSLTREQIDMLLHKVDERHWPQITAMRVNSYYPLDTPVPPQAPEHLKQQINWYASMLFKTEADQYEQFRSDTHYGQWLSKLAERITARVMKALERLEDAGTNPLENLVGIKGALILGYHGLTTQGVEKELRALLAQLCDQYERGEAPGQSGATVLSTHNTPSRSENLEAAEPTRESLAEQITLLKEECDITAEAIAKAVKIEPRSVFKHLAGYTMPRRQHAAAYEKLFSELLGRSVTLQKVREKSHKGHSKVTKGH